MDSSPSEYAPSEQYHSSEEEIVTLVDDLGISRSLQDVYIWIKSTDQDILQK